MIFFSLEYGVKTFMFFILMILLYFSYYLIIQHPKIYRKSGVESFATMQTEIVANASCHSLQHRAKAKIENLKRYSFGDNSGWEVQRRAYEEQIYPRLNEKQRVVPTCLGFFNKDKISIKEADKYCVQNAQKYLHWALEDQRFN